MIDRNTVLLVGARDTGKSNFLFRFWLAIRDGSVREVMPRGLPDDAEYLNIGSNALLQGEYAGHTPPGTGSIVSIPILAAGDPAVLTVPDQPGEDWMRVHDKRRLPPEWLELFSDKTACLVFVRPQADSYEAPLDWIQLQRVLGGNAANLAAELVPQTNSKVPTQVVVVEWIQMMDRLLRNVDDKTSRPRIGIVVAAWDMLSADDREGGPREYLRSNFRLLSDFLTNNSHRFDFELFGVSLLGGDLVHEKGFKAKLLKGDVRKAGYVMAHGPDGSVVKKDLTHPVSWALGIRDK